jgi:hypothetical protein
MLSNSKLPGVITGGVLEKELSVVSYRIPIERTPRYATQ